MDVNVILNTSMTHFNVSNSTVVYVNVNVTDKNDTDVTLFNRTNSCGTVHDIGLHKSTRLAILYLTMIFGILGCALVLFWMTCNRKVSPGFNHLSRVNSFILNLTFADLLVILLAVFPQLIWEYVDREWSAGPVMCRLVKFLQSFSMMSSNYILVVIAIDRHQAIRAPLKESWPVWKMAGLGWLIAALCSLPMFGVFHLTERDGSFRCEAIFRNKPMSHRQIWIAYICFAVFFIPLLILTICYTRIFWKVAQKANENKNKKTLRFKCQTAKVKIQLQSTKSTSLPRAKIKTLKLTFVIIMTFVVCSLPYFVLEMIMSFGDHCIISRAVYGFFGGMAACNSAANPFIFLGFNVTFSWLKEVRARIAASRKRKPRFVYSATSSMDSHPSLRQFGNGRSSHTFSQLI
ncbi:cephalotocin receptor 2-like [Mercenaria mercenaria]|uniref:cephalotocin receptor 2-like n=1 Tax=Mercenaria mercenaria TaxID=6596 RepID=UPI001E1D7FED|nr:cephalotocin receptor 2-like [Mercenaria mercenaria]